MTFRFNFSTTTSETIENENSALEKVISNEEQLSSIRCEFINLVDLHTKKLPPHEKYHILKCADYNIRYIKQNELESIGNLGMIEEAKSDLLPGKYEGGLKVWECAVDLSQFLAEKSCIKAGSHVLELGCGVGLPGIVAYLSGGIVTFQDFNSEVLEFVTAPNVLLNTLEEEQGFVAEKCQFLCGDWKQIKDKYYSGGLNHKEYDYIITSETLYEKCNHRKLLDLMKCALKSDGEIYIASKVHYFGVGGGILDFEKLLKEDKAFECATIFRTEDGVERRILKLKFKCAEK